MYVQLVTTFKEYHQKLSVKCKQVENPTKGAELVHTGRPRLEVLGDTKMDREELGVVNCTVTQR